ncbi:SCP2 sterol-binding domain-containing protein [Streptomyces sp. ISL-12]|nr:SCP2 sterol-binding domain-containing protein [Streptomyces sp. ISL-12]
MTGTAELRDGVRGGAGRGAPDLVAALTAEQVFQSMAVRLHGPRAAEAGRLLRWEITRPSATEAGIWTLLLSNGALTSLPGDAPRGEAPDVTLRLGRPVLDEVVGRRTTFADAIGAGRIAVTGDVGALVRFGGLPERPDPRFAIVTP